MPNLRHRELDYRSGVSGTFQTFDPFPSLLVQTQTVGGFKTCDDAVCTRHEKRVPNALLIVDKRTELPVFNGQYPKEGTPLKQLINCPSDYRPSEPSPGAKFPALSTIEQSSLAWESLAATNPNVAHVSLPTYWAELKDLPELWRAWGDKQVEKGEKLWKELLASASRDDKRFVRRLERLTKNILDRLSNPISSPNKPSQVDDVTLNLMEKSPKGYLWYRWGWAPLVRDIGKMWNFTNAVQKRIATLSALTTGTRTIKRRASIRNSSDSDAPTTIQLKSVGAFIQGKRTVTYSERVWCTVQWKLASSYQLSGVGLEFDDLWIKAHQITLGLTTQDALSALWEIMPWSWFVDWFLHVQTVMDATKNTIPVTWGDICLMRHTRAEARCEPLNSSPDLAWCSPSGAHVQFEDRKQRLLVSPILPFAPSLMPVFTTSQWSILGSLAVIRLAGR